MAVYLSAIIAFSVLILATDVWFYVKMKKHGVRPWLRKAWFLPGILFILTFIYLRYSIIHNESFQYLSRVTWIFVAFALLYTPKILYILFYYLNYAFNKIFRRQGRVFRFVGVGFALIFTIIFVYGVFVTRDAFYLKEQVIEVEGLPEGFDGYRIALFADFHLGNWDRRYGIMKPIATMINQSNPDIIVFAGDMVNNYHQETYGWEPYFRQLSSRKGNFAVLGNHDYGDYTQWKSATAKEQNFEQIKKNIRDMGFRLLLNEHVELENRGDTLTLVGVENFGGGHFNDYSDLNKALAGSDPHRMKILITHDPSHWREEVVGKKPEIFLSMSGHTHAGQVGIATGALRYSPISVMYPEWEGLYREKNQYLYVNRGIGYVGIPIRIGMPPEITLIVLKKKNLSISKLAN
ncbi:MAG TPA: metallophosphoesterase [Porphyromonadaceae bacterium]|nr:metallophosphoesterase [Porphyromonadaceae bacterium]